MGIAAAGITCGAIHDGTGTYDAGTMSVVLLLIASGLFLALRSASRAAVAADRIVQPEASELAPVR